MNKTMTIDELNMALCKVLGICWHGRLDDVCPVCHCKQCPYKPGDYKCVDAEQCPTPNLLRQIEVKCDKCGGEGKIDCNDYFPSESDDDGCGYGWCEMKCSKRSTCDEEGYVSCPCKGQSRLITALQHELEKRGEWEKFLLWHYSQPANQFTNEPVNRNTCPFISVDYLIHARILTDAYQLGLAVLAWKEG